MILYYSEKLRETAELFDWLEAKYCKMTRDLHPRWWRFVVALALLFALVLLVPQVQHGHASLLFVALAPLLLFLGVVLRQQYALFGEQSLPLNPFLPLPSLSLLPPPSTPA